MNRVLGTFAFALLSGAVFAQAPFTIVKPVDGSKVREVVRVLIPKNSVPPGGYIGFFLGGKFIEATVPPLDKTKKFYEYDLDTKHRHIEDGKLNLEAVLYEDFEEHPRIVNRSSVDITVQNSAESNIPPSGIYLRYKWDKGTESIYDYTSRVIIDTADSKSNAEGGRANEVTGDERTIRLLYATENRYSNGDGLVRVQPLPEPGKDYGYFLIGGTHMKFMDYEMAAVYQRLSPTGLEVFGSIPIAFPLEGTTGEAVNSMLFAAQPLPTLPVKKVRPGSSWTARYQREAIDLNNVTELKSLVNHFDARGEFKDVEWEMGHPCAKIEDSIEVGQESEEARKLKAAGRDFSGEKVKINETVWFALDRGEVVKIVRTATVETKITTQNNFGAPGVGGGPTSGAPGGPGRLGGPRNSGAGGSSDKIQTPVIPPLLATEQELAQVGSRKGGRMGPGGPGFGAGPSGGGFGRRGQNGGVSPASTTFIRYTVEQVFILEQ